MLAEEKGLDLVEIAPTATPPVCRIMNSGKFFYQQAKRESEARKHQRHIQVKEVKFRPKIDEHDFQFKKRNAERFLLDGNKVKSTVIFRGREMAHSEIGLRILRRLGSELLEVAHHRGRPPARGHDHGADPEPEEGSPQQAQGLEEGRRRRGQGPQGAEGPEGTEGAEEAQGRQGSREAAEEATAPSSPRRRNS